LIVLASELGYFLPETSALLNRSYGNLDPQLESLIQTMELKLKTEREHRPGLKTKD
jgi:hypothetical protein